MILEIVKYPDPILRSKAQKVTDFDANLHNFLDNMYETMESSNGIGLAAIQVGDLRHALIIKIPKDYENLSDEELDEIEEKSYDEQKPKPKKIEQKLIDINNKDEDGAFVFLEVINAKILSRSGEIFWKEGCLSIPDYFDHVKRARHIEVSFQDRFGKEHKLEAHGLLAVVFQHEIDHLNGVLFIDRLSIMKRKKFDKNYAN
ncbi:MAG: peptide deformylase [Helicobacter sp.]|nr:peptide deformylase [Helicobacter sp.]